MKIEYLNEMLIKQNKVSKKQQKELVKIYDKIEYLTEFSKHYKELEPNDVVKVMETLECELQKNWNFEVTPDKHSHWNRLHNCTCSHGTGFMRLYDKKCYWHGEK